jgi:hypothetical protein
MNWTSLCFATLFLFSCIPGESIPPKEYPKLNMSRSSHTTTQLSNDDLVIIGGIHYNETVSAIEVIDSDRKSTIRAHLSVSRYLHSSHRLQNGNIVVIGGYRVTNGVLSYVTEIEEYNPTTHSVATVANLNYARGCHRSVLLDNGKILIIGGDNGAPLQTAELYNPSTQVIEQVIQMNQSRSDFDIVKMSNSDVLVFGGVGSNLGSIERFNYQTGQFESAGNLITARCALKALLLQNGTVLLTGGYDLSSTLRVAEIYDPMTRTVTDIGHMNFARDSHTVTLLSNGKVLIIGGASLGISTNSMELFDPLTNTFKNIGLLDLARDSHTATLTTNGQIVIVGGFYGARQMPRSEIEVIQ